MPQARAAAIALRAAYGLHADCVSLRSPTGQWPQAFEIAATVSRRKHLLSSAASSGVSGGTNRVFTRPACGAFVMIAKAQKPRDTWGTGSVGSRTRNCFIR